MSGQRHVLAALPPRKILYSLYRRLGETQGRSGRMREISPPKWDSIPWPSSSYEVAAPTELSQPALKINLN